MMIGINALGIDVFTPGNWDYGYGPAVFRGHFGKYGPFPTLPANIRVMSSQIACKDLTTGNPTYPVIPGLTDTTSGYSCTERDISNTPNNATPVGSGVIKANFPVVSANTYNDAPVPNHNRMMDPYKIFYDFNDTGVNIAVIGLSAAIVPQQADVFNIGLRFTQGVQELPGVLKEVKDAGADIVVVQSELGLSQNLYLAQHFSDIDVMYSAHTHEVTLGAMLAHGKDVTVTTPGRPLSRGEARQLVNKNAAIVVETNRDMYVGRLDLTVSNGQITNFEWKAIPTTITQGDPTKPNPDIDTDMYNLVQWIEAPFVSGPDLIRHTFMPGGYCTPADSLNPAADDCLDTTKRGIQLTEGLDTVVGHHVLEDTLNNFIADAIRTVTDAAVKNGNGHDWTGVDISMANGFRFGNAVLPDHDITLRDLYTWFPIAPAVNVGDFSGQAIKKSLDTILSAVFNRNPFQQRGGWYLGLSGMKQTIDLKNQPYSSSSGRIVSEKVGNNDLDLSKRYVFASCYGQGNPMDEVCRTSGGADFQFFELADPDDYNSNITVVNPKQLNVPVIKGTIVQQVAPDSFLHPVAALRRYLDNYIGGQVTWAQFGAGQGRVLTVDTSKQPSDPAYVESIQEQAFQPDNTPDPTFVQPPYGAGPAFLSGVAGDR
jgi:2',3'-cyclic-nucleotide 2'-phosphodiesterase (5'-nucleotidase family)